ncbi:zinc ribbon domain-containing protein [Promethearchaeum syntrophicum]|uniref:Zinc ribbon domain-containing protein n=1 Tax=Promethearchaeum syntrophicum TaxID=2594042 RepID=A0A5B9DCC2_9ARCH|nr:zinc ribbon domain-containing protein [Candidatus Prometheoarchaeum syntrophicum]QEE16949.1 hypothetical protein DSAG12_02780 [Candidatus Prometheoarchaeum syntrophicum]
MPIDNRKKSYYEFGKSMKYYSISKWIYEVINIILNFFIIIGLVFVLIAYIDPYNFNYSTFEIIIIIYTIAVVIIIILFLITASISFIFFIYYLVRLYHSSEHDENGSLKKSYILEIVSIVLSIILPITVEFLSLILDLFIPGYNYSFIIPDVYGIIYDMSLNSLIISISIFILRIILGYIPRILKAIAQKNLRKWTDDLFEFPQSPKERERLEHSIIKGTQSMKIGQMLGIFRIVRVFGKIMYNIGLGTAGKGLMKSFEEDIYTKYVNSNYPTIPQQNNTAVEDDIPRFCAYCGYVLIPNSKFCGKCGKSF